MHTTRAIRRHRTIPLAITIGAVTAFATLRAQTSDLQRRIGDVEATQPDLTAERSTRNERELAAIRTEMDAIKKDGDDTVKTLNYLCGHLGIPVR